MIRVLHVIENFNGQAVESWLTRLVTYEGFDSSRLHFDFFLLGEGPGRYASAVLDQGCLVQLGNPGGASITQMARALRRQVQAGTYDIVHIHQDVLAGIFALALVGTGVQIVTHVHNCWQRLPVGGQLKERILTAIARQLTLKLSQAIVGVSNQALDKMTGGIRRKHRIDRVIYCSAKSQATALSEAERVRVAAEVRHQYSLPSSSKLVVFLGRLDTYKNPVFALEVLREMVAQGNVNACLIIAGVGGLDGQLRELTVKSGLEERVRIIGWLEDPSPLLQSSDLLLMPSQEWCGEGLGLAAVEAQGCGLPVLCSTSIPADAEIIPSLFKRLSVRFGAAQWSVISGQMLARGRSDPMLCQKTLNASHFTVEASYQNLQNLYALLICS